VAKWKVLIEIDEDTVRSFHEQTREDPPTEASDVRELLSDAFSALEVTRDEHYPFGQCRFVLGKHYSFGSVERSE
jgi:hypothetical protein